jgi:predicted TIM-barrel fold metal-dependent hydrolase
VAGRHLNLWVEPFTGGTARGKLEQAVEKLGAHRVVFGTNFPRLNAGVALGMLADATLSEADRRAILGGNAARLFQLNQTRESD